MENVVVTRGALALPIVLSCEHASGLIPEEFNNLGMSEQALARCQDRLDIGAREYFDGLLGRLDCFGVRSRLSRLIIDVNRNLDQPELIRTACGEDPIPANEGLSEQQRRERIERWYLPYHEALRGLLEGCERRHNVAFLFPIHTMASEYNGQPREMDIALLSREGCPVGKVMQGVLEGRGLSVSCNEPFHLLRNIIRTPYERLLTRFNKTAVIVEVNDRHQGDVRIIDALEAAIIEAVRRCSKLH